MSAEPEMEPAAGTFDRLQNIVVGVDYSPCSRNAVKEAIRIAKWNQSPLHVVHIIYNEALAETSRATGVDADAIVEARTMRLERFVFDLVDEKEEIGFIHCECIVGHPFHEIMQCVKTKKADLLVLGSHGNQHDEPSVTGVLASKCVRKAPCKVLLVREAQDHRFEKVVAAVDFSETSRLALHEAARIARQDECKLNIVHVYTPAWQHFMEEHSGGSLVVPEDEAERYLREVNERLADFIYDCLEEFEGMHVESEVVAAVSVGYGITDYLEKEDAELVVIGTRGRSLIRMLLIGSTAEHIVRDSKCSVLTVKPEGFSYGNEDN